MNSKHTRMILIGCVLPLAGCSSFRSKSQEASQSHWNRVRAKIKYQLALQHYEAGRAAEAAQTAKEVMALDPENIEALALLTKSFIERGQYRSAERALAATQNLSSEDPIFVYLEGVLHERRGDQTEALDCFRRANEAAPNNLDYFVARVESMVSNGAPDVALELIRTGPVPIEDDATVNTLEARLAMMTGDLEGATTAYRAAVRASGHPSLTVEYATLLARVERFREAQVLLEPLLANASARPMEGVLRRTLARCHIGQGNIQAVSSVLQMYTRKAPKDIGAQLLFATAALSLEHEADAIRAASTILRTIPNQPEALLILAEAHRRAGRYEASARAIDTLLQVDPGNRAAQAIRRSLEKSADLGAQRMPLDRSRRQVRAEDWCEPGTFDPSDPAR